MANSSSASAGTVSQLFSVSPYSSCPAPQPAHPRATVDRAGPSPRAIASSTAREVVTYRPSPITRLESPSFPPSCRTKTHPACQGPPADRKTVVQGQSVSVLVALVGGGSLYRNKKTQ